MITAQTLTDAFPELAAKTSGQLQSAIADAYAQSDPDIWESTALYDMYVKYLAAHLVSLFGAGGSNSSETTTGAISKRRVGDVEITYSEGGSSSSTSTQAGAAVGEESYFDIAQRLLKNNANAHFVVY